MATDIDALAAQMQQNTREALGLRDPQFRANTTLALDTNPDTFARERVVARALDVPTAAVTALPKEAERRAKLNAIDEETASTPVLREKLATDADFAKLVHDDIDSMSTLERVATGFKSSYLGAKLAQGVYSLGADALTLAQGAGELAGLTTSEADLAVVYHDDPVTLRKVLKESPAMALVRYARQLTQQGDAALEAVSDDEKAKYGGKEYFTLDAERSALLSPVTVTGDLLASLPEAFATGGTFFFARAAGKEALSLARAAGLSEQEAAAAATKAAAKTASTVGAASEGSIGYAQNYNQTREEAARIDPTTLAQNPDYQALLQQGYTPMAASIKMQTEAADKAGVIAGIADAAVNAAAGKFLGKLIAETGPALKKIGGGMLQEGITEAVQSPLEQLGSNVGLQGIDPSQSLTKGLGEAAVQGLVLGGLTGGAFSGVNVVADKMARDSAKAKQAQIAGEMLQQVDQLVAGAKAKARAPEVIHEFAQALTEDGQLPEHVYVSAEVLAQSGALDALAQAIPSVGEQVQNALASNVDIQIPMADYLTAVGGTQLNQQIAEHLRVDPNGLTFGESQQFQQKAGEELQRDVEALFQKAEGDDAFKASREAVRDNIKAQLDAADHFSGQVNSIKATFVAAHYATRAAQLGVMPEEYFKRNPLMVVGQQPVAVDPRGLTQRLAETKAAYEQRIDTLFSGGGARAKGVRMLDRADVLDLLGYGDKPLHLQESAVGKKDKATGGVKHPGMTAEMWKRVPEWIENPVAVFKSQTVPGALVMFGPELVNGRPVRITLEPSKGMAGMDVHVTTNAYEEGGTGKTPVDVWAGEKKALLYLDQKQSPTFAGRSGLQLPSEVRQLRGYKHSVQTDEDLSKYRAEPEHLLQQNDAKRGMYLPAYNLISLLEKADLSTFLHEAGHAFLQMDMTLAAQLLAKGELLPGEQEILSDVSALLRWFGVGGDIQHQLAQWANMSKDEFTAHHEKLAEAFEAYLAKGRAPSIELQPIFNRFAAWLKQVYKSAKEYLTNAGKPLTPEIEQVFDRMLATGQQIQLAEQTRSMMPLFETAEDASKVGMTPEQLGEFHRMHLDATQDAVNSLQGRSIRDMKWLSGARSKMLKALQKQAEETRREVRTAVRAEVMSQPVYRAWAFLTGRMTDEDKVGKRASKAKGVDERRDSLFVAIAKLGGLDIAQAQEEWGLDPAERIEQPVFGKPVLRRDGGKSIDAMAELLAEVGYLRTDEHGKYDLHEFSDRFFEELRGVTQYSMAVDHDLLQAEGMSGALSVPENVGAGRISRQAARDEFGDGSAEFLRLEHLKMLRTEGYHPSAVANAFGFDSADALVKAVMAATPPRGEVEGRTDQRMLEEHSDFATEGALEAAADKAIHSEAHARFLSTQLVMLDRALKARAETGKVDRAGRPVTYAVLPRAARQYAQKMIAGLRVRDIKPGQFASAAARAAVNAKGAFGKGDIEVAAAESRNQLLNVYAAKAAYEAQDEVRKAVDYFKRLDTDAARKRIGADYMDQIDTLLEKVDLRKGVPLKALDKRERLAAWVANQEAGGLEVDVPAYLLEDAYKTSYKNMTVEELRGLLDTIKMLEHLGTTKQRLLTAKARREWAAIRDEMANKLAETSKGRSADTRTPTDWLGKRLAAVRRFGAAHIKAATWARIFDGGEDGGPWWEYLIRPANDRADAETKMRAEATERLMEIMAPVLASGAMTSKRKHFDSIDRSLNRLEVFVMALNTGNEGNLQRLLGGEGWTMSQLQPALATLTAADWAAVQAVWDHFESYRPMIAAKERRIYGKEPNWVEHTPFTVTTADGQKVDLRGGYYPIKYDPAASLKAEQFADADSAKQAMGGAKSVSTTRRSYTKDRAAAVEGRPLVYTLAGLFTGTNEVIHDVVWHEWVIDAQRMMRSGTLDKAIRDTYGPEAKGQLKKWVNDIAAGDAGAQEELDTFMGWMRRSVSVAGLGFNVASALLQVTGFVNSIARVGLAPMSRVIPQFIANPRAMMREVRALSSFMSERGRTQFRDLNEIANKVNGQNKLSEVMQKRSYLLIQVMQGLVDVPTWKAAYEKAVAAGEGDDRAVALADQAVRDSQGSGLWADQSGVERGGSFAKLFTVFYSYMNTVLNSAYALAMTAKGKGDAVAKVALLTVLAPVLTAALKDAMTPDGGDDDDFEALLRKYGAEVVASNMGLFVGLREFASIGKGVVDGKFFGYSGPAGLRMVDTVSRFTQQAYQGEVDKAFVTTAVDLGGVFLGIPSAQVNRTFTGWEALADGQTDNPAALVMGYKR